MFGKINIYILFLRAYVVRGFDVVANIARFCRRVFVLRAFVTARFCLGAFVCAVLPCALLLRRHVEVLTRSSFKWRCAIWGEGLFSPERKL